MNNNIRDVRKKKNMTQADFAAKLGISITTLRTFEKNSIYPRINLVEKMTKILDCDFWDLYCKN